jgi:hypothetical protein
MVETLDVAEVDTHRRGVYGGTNEMLADPVRLRSSTYVSAPIARVSRRHAVIDPE